jgi:hypothetical protein
LECLQQTDSKLELRETAIGYFSEISKILKSDMAPILSTVLTEIMKSLNSEDGIKPQLESRQKKDFSLDSDSDESGDEVVGFDINNSFIDEKAAAIHALGNIALNCSSLVFPHMAAIITSL